jgi:hypothetical protein
MNMFIGPQGKRTGSLQNDGVSSAHNLWVLISCVLLGMLFPDPQCFQGPSHSPLLNLMLRTPMCKRGLF